MLDVGSYSYVKSAPCFESLTVTAVSKNSVCIATCAGCEVRTENSILGSFHIICILSIDVQQRHIIGPKTVVPQSITHRKIITGLINKKTRGPVKNTVDTSSLFLSGMTLEGSWSVVGGVHDQAFTFFMVLEPSRSRSVVSNANVQAFTFFTAQTLSRSRSVA